MTQIKAFCTTIPTQTADLTDDLHGPGDAAHRLPGRADEKTAEAWPMRAAMFFAERFQDAVVQPATLTCCGLAGAPLWHYTPVATTLAGALYELPKSDGLDQLAFESLPDKRQAEIAQYAILAARSYAPRVGYEDMLGARFESPSTAQTLWRNYRDTAQLQRLHHLQPVVPVNLTPLASALKVAGFYLSGPHRNIITSAAGMNAQISMRDTAKGLSELVIAFPGLGSVGTDRHQHEQRVRAVIHNFLPFASELYSQAEILVDILSRYKSDLMGSEAQSIDLTLVGHSLGGSLAMSAAGNVEVSQCIVFQPLPPLWGKMHLEASRKVVEVLITEDSMIPKLLQGCVPGTLKVICQKDPNLTLPSHSYIVPYLNSAINNSAKPKA